MGRRWLIVALGVAAVLIAGAIVVVMLGMPRPVVAQPSPDPTAPTVSPPTAPVEPSAPPTPTTPARADPTCENIMAPGFLPPDLAHWVPAPYDEPEPLFAAGVQCWWSADPTVGTDNVLAYGWVPADEASWTAFVEERLSTPDAPWFVEAGERGEYLTEKTDYWVRDEEGYGMTYLFTGDAVIFAQTKAETRDVVGPPSQ